MVDGISRSGGVRPGPAPAQAAQTDAANDQIVTGLYQELLGRAPDPQGYHAHMKALESGRVDRDGLRAAIMGSPEFQQRLARLNQLDADASVAKAAAPVVGPAAIAPPPAAPRSFPVGPIPLEGYDNAKLNDPAHQTTKYRFGRVASNYPLDAVKDKAGAEQLLRSMLPDLQAAGLNVKDVQGDKIRIETELGDEWVDVVRGAGGGNPGWWWGSEGKAIPGTEKSPGGVPSGPAPTGPAAGEPGAPLATVPLTPAMKAAADAILARDPGLKARPAALTEAVATYVKEHGMAPMPVGDDRQAMMDVMTQVIGVIRSMGLDAHRVVNHPTIPAPGRYGSDAVVLNGRIYDVYRSFGQDNAPVQQDVGPWDQARAKGLRE